jgi:hypothetical protein
LQRAENEIIPRSYPWFVPGQGQFMLTPSEAWLSWLGVLASSGWKAATVSDRRRWLIAGLGRLTEELTEGSRMASWVGR